MSAVFSEKENDNIREIGKSIAHIALCASREVGMNPAHGFLALVHALLDYAVTAARPGYEAEMLKIAGRIIGKAVEEIENGGLQRQDRGAAGQQGGSDA